MATYEYECPEDGERITITRSMHEEEGVYVCTLCGCTVHRVYSSPPVKFNATGFYSTGG